MAFWIINLGIESSSLWVQQKLSFRNNRWSRPSVQRTNSINSWDRQSINPIITMSRDMSQWEMDSNNNDEYEITLKEFELSQLNQKLRKPRNSNFLPDFDLYNLQGNKLSICRTSRKKMNTIQEDDQSSKSNNEDINTKSVTSQSDHDSKEHTIEVIGS